MPELLPAIKKTGAMAKEKEKVPKK